MTAAKEERRLLGYRVKDITDGTYLLPAMSDGFVPWGDEREAKPVTRPKVLERIHQKLVTHPYLFDRLRIVRVYAKPKAPAYKCEECGKGYEFGGTTEGVQFCCLKCNLAHNAKPKAPEPKSLGQIAHEAFAAAHGCPSGEWEAFSNERQSWEQAGALAVAEEVRRRVMERTKVPANSWLCGILDDIIAEAKEGKGK